MHEVDQDVVVMYTLVKIFVYVFESYVSLWGFWLVFLGFFRVSEGFWGFLRVYEGCWVFRVFEGFYCFS